MWWFRWRCNPLSWLWGVLPLALIALMAIWGEQDRIEADLTKRTTAALTSKGIGWVKPDFEGRDGSLKGSALSDHEKQQARKIMNDVWGVRQINDRASLVTRISPYTWSAERKRRELILTGYIPGEAERRDILSIIKSRFPRLRVRDKLVVAPGVPDDTLWMDGVDFGLRQLAKMSAGSVSLRDLDVTLQGFADSASSYDTIKSAISDSLPDGIELGNDKVLPPLENRYQLHASKQGNSVSVTGFMPAKENIRRIRNMLDTGNFRRLDVNADLKLASGAPENWSQAVRNSLLQLSRLEKGQLKINKHNIRLTGTSSEEHIANDIKSIMESGLPDDYSAQTRLDWKTAEITPPEIPKIDKFTWSLQKRVNTIQLNGFVASEELRSRMEDMARTIFHGYTVINKLKVARGGPSDEQQWRVGNFAFDRLASLKNGRVWIENDKISVAGTPSDRWSFQDALESMNERLPDGFRKGSVNVQPPEIDQYRWSIERNDHDINLNGYIENDQLRKNLISKIKREYPGFNVIDNMRLGTGVPTGVDWKRAQAYALKQLRRLGTGEITLNGTKLRIEGKSASADDFSGLNADLKNVPPGFTIDEPEISAPEMSPYTWRADYMAGRVTLSGYINDEETRKGMVRFAEEQFPSSAVIDRMEIAAGGVSGWDEVAKTGLRELKRLDSGSVSIWDSQVEIRGVARDEITKRSVYSNVRRTADRQFTFKNRLREYVEENSDDEDNAGIYEGNRIPYDDSIADTEIEADTRLSVRLCEIYLNTAIRRVSLKFQTASSKVSRGSVGVLRNLAHIANRCPGTKIEIAGHTDSDGNEAFNQRLSLRRAREVTSHLVRNGVRRSRLVAVGYGESRPVAPNNNAVNKARNRRIEFRVREREKDSLFD